MSDTLLRQWELMRAIPRHPKKVDVATLMTKLEAAGYAITKRSIQRDLNSLSRIFPIQSDDQSIPYGWSWSSDAPAFDLPNMDAPTALTLRLIEQFLPTLLPAALREHLVPQFERARAVLSASPGGAMGNWADRVRVLPREMPLLPPTYNDEAIRVVYDALLAGKRFTAQYRSRALDTDELKIYEVSPLGIVARGNLLYLVCTLWDYQDLRQLALHRVLTATPTDIPITASSNFDLDRYIAEGEFHIPVGPMITIKLKMERGAAEHLHETPLAADQTIESHDAGYAIVRATVLNTAQLEWWIAGFGSLVEVLEPLEMRDRMRQAAAALDLRYRAGFGRTGVRK